jgi:outer membrane receptor for ferrienterochelin and colicins
VTFDARLLALAALLSASRSAAQPTSSKATSVVIAAVSDTSLRPLAGADVSFAGSGVQGVTDASGRIRFVNAPAGRFVMIVRSIGYRPATHVVEIANDDTLHLAFTLEPTTQTLGTVVVTERSISKRLEEFEQRRKAGIGQFFTHQDIEDRHATTIADVLRTARGLRVEPAAVGGGSNAGSTRGGFGTCFMMVYIDGVPLSSSKADAVSEPFDLTLLPPPNQIAAMEVYAGASEGPVWLPQGSGGRRGCGSILVWTATGS